MIGVPELLGGIGILLRTGWGRIIGIIYSLMFGALSVQAVLTNRVIGAPAGIHDPSTAGIATTVAIFYWTALVLSAYSLIVLVFRWRGPATA